MNSSFLRILAIILVMGAITTAWLGYQISSKPSPEETPAAVIAYQEVVARQDIPSGKQLTAEDVSLQDSDQLHSGVFNNPTSVIGKFSLVPISKGSTIHVNQLSSLSRLAPLLNPEERAVAISVNETIGVGGFVNPGDHVDVLLYLPTDGVSDNTGSSQILLENVRVLAYGDVIGDNGDLDKLLEAAIGIDTDAGQRMAKQAEIRKENRSAILAVPKDQVMRLMLAESSGTLKLALRDVHTLDAPADEGQITRLQTLTRATSQDEGSTQGREPPEQDLNKKTQDPTAAKRDDARQIIIHRGERVEVITVKK